MFIVIFKNDLVTEGEGLITVKKYKNTYLGGILDKVKEKKLHNTYLVGIY